MFPQGLPGANGRVTLYAMPGLSAMQAAIQTISSRENRWLKRFRAALRGERDAEGLVGLEGPHLVEEALRSGLEVSALLFSASGEMHWERLSSMVPPATQVLRTSDRLFASVAGTEVPQGIAALARRPECSFDRLL